eukprot:TRINITY_DN9589_c0_g1_i1.p1 TRINITY_DN9589_c0_g1~~TRINITY_DN9589_c0_g1_i1.p1  ORF type:complete len:329 (-),score=43.78 TRINITY_DN9589_c0_g1_i1:63-1049(-)
MDEDPVPVQPKIQSVIQRPDDGRDQRSRDSRRNRGREDRNGRGKGEKKYRSRRDPPHEEHHLNDDDQITSDRPHRDVGIAPRLVLTAVKDAKDSTSSPSEAPKREKRSLGDEIMVTVNLDRPLGSSEDYDLVEGTKKKKTNQRCTYWPNCKRGQQCVYIHPSERCKMYPWCSYANNCMYIHPQSTVPCKYAALCTKADCLFTHPILPQVPQLSQTPNCKFGFACSRQGCKYGHPQELCRFGKSCTKGGQCAFSHAKECLYGANCSRSGCTFAHPKKSQTSKIACKFGDGCRDQTTCPFSHDVVEISKDAMTTLDNSLPTTPPRNEIFT